MRVSSHQLLQAGIDSIQQQSVEAMDWQRQISSGKRYNKASQGAVAITRGVEIQFDKSKYNMLKANQDFVATRMALADAQLGSMGEVMADMQRMATQAQNPAIGKIGLQSLAQEARAAYDQLAQQAVAMDTNDERYLLRTTNVAALDPPRTTITGDAISTATVADDVIFVKSGSYEIYGYTERLDGDDVIKEMKLQIEGKGPDGTSATHWIGRYNNGLLTFDQEPEAFFNLRFAITGEPDASTVIDLEANPVTVRLDPTSRLHGNGRYAIELNRGDDFTNGHFETAGVVFEGTTATVEGWVGSLSATNTSAGSFTMEFSTEIPVEDQGYSLSLVSTGITATDAVVGPTVTSAESVYLKQGDQINFKWKADSSAGISYNPKAYLVNLDTGDEILISPALTGTGSLSDWSTVSATINKTANPDLRDGNYTLRFESGATAASYPSAVNQSTTLYIDDVKTVINSERDVTKATLTYDGEPIKTITKSSGVNYDESLELTTLDFGSSSASPAGFYDLKLTLTGDPVNLRSQDDIRFRVDAKVRQIEIEPGIWVPEGISFREALGNTTAKSRDVLADALAFVESLERAAVSGILESDFGGKISNLRSAADQVLQYQVRAGVIGAQVDAAKAALETKATELEAFRSRLLDTDIAEASAGLVRTQTLLEAARSIFARLESSNLFQRLM
jgi:flagellin-like hook-associated protein FlgL